MIALLLTLAVAGAAPAKGAPATKAPAANVTKGPPAPATPANPPPAPEEVANDPAALDAETMAFLSSSGATNAMDGAVKLDWPGPGGGQL